MTVRRLSERALAAVVSALTGGLLSLASPGSALADNATTAQALFDEGKKLLAEKRFAEACPKFETSQKLDPGGGTLLFVALCHKEVGKVATAWAEFNQALSVARRDKRKDREAAAQEHIDALAPILTKLTIIVPPVVSSLNGLEVRRDGAVIDRSTWGVAVPVDPGTLEIKAEASGRESWRTSVDATQAGASLTVTIPELSPAKGGSNGWPSTRRIVGGVVGGVGVVSVGVGIATGIITLGKASIVKDPAHCDASLACDQVGVDAAAAAKTLSIVSPVTLAVGAAAMGVGIFLFVSGGEPRAAVTATPREGGVTLDFAHRF